MSTTVCIGSFFGHAVDGQQECGPCYQMDIGSIVGILACDLILTVLIAVSIFCFAPFRKNRRGRDSSEAQGKPPTVSNKMAAEMAESPYQELQGVQSDVYSDLQHFRK